MLRDLEEHPMRKICILAFTLSALTLVACGGGGGGVNVMPDAHTTTHPDAMVSMPDANTTSNENGAALGNQCSQTMTCPATTPDCIGFTQGNNFCSFTCGTTQGTSTNPGNPPTGGNTTCANMYTGTATPVCAGVDACPNGTCTWSCALACGTFMGQNLGTCPANLTCNTTNNLCGA
jgi:hypothetical protein